MIFWVVRVKVIHGEYLLGLFTLSFLSYFVLCNAQKSTRSFVLKISEDGESTLTAYLPAKPSGRAVVCMPAG